MTEIIFRLIENLHPKDARRLLDEGEGETSSQE
jgi:hypothetical protein